jgi:hypothetical protein
MLLTLMLDGLHCVTSHDHNIFNDHDELFFTLGGSTNLEAIIHPRISPPPPQDYYSLKDGDDLGAVELHPYLFLPDGSAAWMTIVLREQDNAQFAAIGSLVTGAVAIVGTLVTGGALLPAIVAAIVPTAQQLVQSLLTDGNANIGAVNCTISHRGPRFDVQWDSIADSTISGANNGAAVTVGLTGASANYLPVRFSVQRPTLTVIVNKLSGKALDVPDLATGDGARLQQFSRNDGPNQRWLLNYTKYNKVGAVSGNINQVRVPGWPVYLPFPNSFAVIVSDNSGKCLDVPDASRTGGVQIQQFSENGGDNQFWAVVPDQQGYFVIVNLNSGQVLDVRGNRTDDHAEVQQYPFNGGDNQRWQLISVAAR